MNRKILFILAACCLGAALTACVQDIHTDEISKEVTVASETLEAPIIKKSKRYLGDIIEDDPDSFLTLGPDGVYRLSHKDNIETEVSNLSIDPIRDLAPELEPQTLHLSDEDIEIPATTELQRTESEAELDIPNFDIGPATTVAPVVSSGTIALPAGIAPGTKIDPNTTPRLNLSVSDYFNIRIQSTLPEQVLSVSRIEFGPEEKGTPVELKLDAGCLQQVSNGGTLNRLTVTYPAGYQLALADTYGGKASVSKGSGSKTDNIFSISGLEFAPQSPMSIEFFMSSIDLPEGSATDGTIGIDDKVLYQMEFAMNTRSASVSEQALPSLGITMTPVMADALLQTAPIKMSSQTQKQIEYTIRGISPDVSKMDLIALTGQDELTVSASPLEFPFDNSDFDVTVTLPGILEFESSPYLSGDNVMTVPYSVLTGGVKLTVKNIAFGPDKGFLNSEGLLVIQESITATVDHTFSAGTVRLSEARRAMGIKKCDITMERAELHIERNRCAFELRSISQDIDTEKALTYSMTLPDEIKTIDRLNVTASDGSPLTATISFIVSDCPVERVYIDNFTVQMPEFLELRGPDISPSGSIEITRREISARSNTPVQLASFEIAGLNNVPVNNGVMEIDRMIKLRGTVRTIDGEKIKGMDSYVTVTPIIDIPDMLVTEFEGIVDINLNDYIDCPSLDLGDIRDNFSDLSLGLSDAEITFDIQNPLGIDFCGDIILHPLDTDGNSAKDVTIRQIKINGAQAGDDYAQTKILITADAQNSRPGYDTYVSAELLEMLRNLPAAIEVEMPIRSDRSTSSHLDLSKAQRPLLIDYAVNVPLKLDNTTSFSYEDQIELSDFFSDIKNKGLKIEHAAVELHTSSDIPIELIVLAEFRDADGNPVDGVDFSIRGSIGGYNPAKDGKAKNTTLSAQIKLRNSDVDLLGKVTCLHISLSGHPSSEVALRSDQYIELSGSIKVRGVSADIDKLTDDNSQADYDE